MRWIIERSMNFRLLISALALILLVLGLLQIRSMPVDAFPEFAPPYIDIQTEAPGLSAPEVEELVTFNLEELLNGTPWLQSIRSTSVPGLSALRLTFENGTDILRARQLVQERLSLAYALPNVAMSPVILQPLSAMSRVLIIGLSSTKISPLDLSVLANWNIRQALLSLPGVANVAIWGLKYKQLQVLADPQKLATNHVHLDQIISTTGNALWVSPLTFLNASTPGTGGWIDTPQQRLEVRHVLPISTPTDLAKVNVESSNLRLGDVTTIVNGHPPLIGDDVFDGGAGILIAVDKFPKANTLEVTKLVEDKLAELAPGLSGIKIDTHLFRPAVFVESVIANIGYAFIAGIVLLILTFFLFMRSWRLVLTSLLFILVTLSISILILNFHGATINLMILSGLVMALIIIIDEAVSYIASILIQSRKEADSLSDAIYICAERTRVPLFYATLIVLLVLVPIGSFTGINNAFFQPLAISYAIAIIVALIGIIIFAPALTLTFWHEKTIARREIRERKKYQRSLQWCYAHCAGGILTALTLLITILALIALTLFVVFKNPPLLPSLKEPEILVQWDGPPGTSLEEMVRISSRVARELRATPGIDSVAVNIGRAVLGDKIVSVNSAQILININLKANYAKTLRAIQQVVEAYPGIFHVIKTYLKDRTNQILIGSSSDIVIRIFGHDFDGLRVKAEEIRKKVAQIKGTADVEIDQQVEQPEIKIEVDLQKAQTFGLKPGDVRRVAATLVAGLEVGSLFEEQKIFPVVVWGAPTVRHSVNDLRNLLIDTPTDKWVRLYEVAKVTIAPSPYLIQHAMVSRTVDVNVNVKGRSADAVYQDIKQSLQTIQFPLEYRAALFGVYQSERSTLEQTLLLTLAVAIIILLLLQAIFESFALAFVIFLTLPFALLGSVIAALAIGMNSTLMLFGLLVVYGLTVRNSILLITAYQALVTENYFERVMQVTSEHFPSLIIAASAGILMLLPFILLSCQPGLEIMGPMAFVIVCGIITSLIYTLWIVPLLYCGFANRKVNDDINAGG